MSLSKPFREMNILLLGESGVGKSTFINAFANFLSYESMVEAENNNLICLIPTRFVVTDENFEQKHVSYGEDKNESYIEEGGSVTQKCRAYCFKFGEMVVRLIDTPGMGDTRGLDHDKINFDNFLSFIAEYKELHLICILLKPDMQRLTSSFRYCFKQLLLHLHKSASENIVFLFTNGRSTLYRPKNTLVLLKEILNDIQSRPPNIVIPIVKHTMYCLDNDSFHFLIALRNGVKFAYEEKNDFSYSWTKSVNECLRLMNYITTGTNGQPLPSHFVQDILSINETRRLIVALIKPLAKIAEKVSEDLEKLEKTKREIENYQGDIKTYVDGIEASQFKLEQSFWDFMPIVNIFNFKYNASKLKNAENIQIKLREQLYSTTGKIQVKEVIIKEFQQVIDDHKSESKKILDSAVKFACFIKSNAIVAYNDAYVDFLLEQIESVKNIGKNEADRDEKINTLKKLLTDYPKQHLKLFKLIESYFSHLEVISKNFSNLLLNY